MNNEEFKFYIFDWDENILHMNTKINMEKMEKDKWISVEIPTSKFTEVRKNPKYRIPHTNNKPDYDKAYINFRDNGLKGNDTFLIDCIDAIDNLNVGPSYLAFKKCIIEASIMIICTARGHYMNTIRKGVQYFIDTQFTPIEFKLMLNNMKIFYDNFVGKYNKNVNLIDEYLNYCDFIGVSCEKFISSINKNDIPDGHIFDPSNTELGKIIAIERFIKKCVNFSKKSKNTIKTIKIGFSDDDLGNINSITKIFKNKLKKIYPDVIFNIYNTSKNDDGTKNYIKHIIK